MAFDGAFLHKLITELSVAENAFVDKIYQPSRDELVFLLRKGGFCKRLLINLRPGAARIQFTDLKYENPPTPPMFCMLMRKYLSAARLIKISQPGLERLAEFTFSYTDEMGDISELCLTAELIGNKTNLILINNNGKIIDALRRSDPENGGRMLLPGAVYEYPEKRNKLNPLELETDRLADIIRNAGTTDSAAALLNTLDGLSPLACREIAYKCELYGAEAAANELKNSLCGCGTPLLLLKADATPQDFSFTDISHYGDLFAKKQLENYSLLLDEFYTARDAANRLKHTAGDIIKLVNTLRARTEKKLALRLEELKSCENREQLRIYGELLKANLYRATPGVPFIEVENYYDNMQTIRIPLDPALSPQKNAAKYFKDYKKSHTAEQRLTELTELDRKELAYFDTVLDSISRSTARAELAEIREELITGGYLKAPAAARRRKPQAPLFKEYSSKEGYKIAVGKNNRQNDYLTTTLAAKNDIWLHIKNIPGSHVIIMCGGREVSEETLIFAATLAAKNSSAAAGARVAVDYTPVKYVKKPNGAKPGMVIYTTNKTVYVTPPTDKGAAL